MFTGRTLFAISGAALLAGNLPAHSLANANEQDIDLEQALAAIKDKLGGSLGVAVSDPVTGVNATRHGDERFPMCSTCKLLAAAAVLHRVDESEEMLSREIAAPRDGILSYAPVTKKHAGGTMTLSDLCAATMVWSDNTAANLILESLGAREAATEYVRSLGDDVTRIDRMGPEANIFGPGEIRDTTTLTAMLGNLKTLFRVDTLSPLSRDRLTEWFLANETGSPAKTDSRLACRAHGGLATGRELAPTAQATT